MGLDVNSVKFLISARKEGVCFDDILTLGRQDLNVFPARIVQILREHALPDDEFKARNSETLYADPLFRALGAKTVSSMDVSAFEGAGFIHDLNEPIGRELRERFDLVYDGGTLEHVFNFPVALKNCMEMVRPGGHLFIHTGTNNWCGHGFYQLSPELFYRALSPENGFAVCRMIIHRVGPYGRWYEVADPKSVQGRVELVTLTPVQLLVQAKRVSSKTVFATPPQQSDYAPRWQAGSVGRNGGELLTKPISYAPSRPKLSKAFPNLARLFHVLRMGLAMHRNQTLCNRKSFQRIKKP